MTLAKLGVKIVTQNHPKCMHKLILTNSKKSITNHDFLLWKKYEIQCKNNCDDLQGRARERKRYQQIIRNDSKQNQKYMNKSSEIGAGNGKWTKRSSGVLCAACNLLPRGLQIVRRKKNEVQWFRGGGDHTRSRPEGPANYTFVYYMCIYVYIYIYIYL